MRIRRREFLKGAGAVGAAGLAAGLAGGRAFAEPGTIDIFSNSDTNVTDFWQLHVKPAFEAANPGVTVNIVPGVATNAMNTVADRAYAALKTGTDPQVDVMEAYQYAYPPGAAEDGLWVDMTEAGLSNMSVLNTNLMDNKWTLPYRGSEVVLFYNTSKIESPPTTFAELVDWIKANPGRFTYARPDVGDSGAVFIERALHEANGQDPDLFQHDNYTPEYAEPLFAKTWAILNDIAPHLYDGGKYTGGNTPSIQLLASGAIDMTVAWSDMALQAMNEGVVPEWAGVAQLQDLSFQGGYSGVLIPNSAANRDLAIQLVDFVVSPEIQNKLVTELGGFPAIDWSVLDPELEAKFKDVIPDFFPLFPSEWEPPLFESWYRNVGTGLQKG